MTDQQPRRTKTASLRKKLLTAMILVPSVPFFLVLGIGYYQFTKSLEDETFGRMQRIAAGHRRVIEMFLNERRGDLIFAADVFSFRNMVRGKALGEVLAELKSKSQAFFDLGVFDSKGTHVAYAGPYELEGKSYMDAPWFQRVMRQGYYVSDIFLGYRKVPHFVVAIRSHQAGETWVLRATIDTQFFNELVEAVCVGETGEAYIINDKGVLQTERRSGGGIMTSIEGELPGLSPRGQVEVFVRSGAEKKEYVYAAAWLNDQKWLLVVRQEVADAFSSLRNATFIGIIILFAGGAGIVAIAFLLTNALVLSMRLNDQEKKDLDQQLIMASRLAELGEMSAGFAHEINNPLQIIRAEQALIEEILHDLTSRGELPLSQDVSEVLDSAAQIRQQVDRCGSITQSILKFARQKDPRPQRLDPGEFLGQVTQMVRNKAEVNGIELNVELDPALPGVSADPGQLQQVILNLLNNAFDSVTLRHGASGGAVRVRAASCNGSVLISVRDNGSGIEPGNKSKIFQPFFTTKPVGKGTGLGLSVCYGIVEKMGGSLKVESEEGRGATFTVELPGA